MLEWVNPTWNILGILSIIIGGVWWFQSQFNANRLYFGSEIASLQKTILDKLEYHERHDDSRFADIQNELSRRIAGVRNDIWEIRLRNAAKDGPKIIKFEEVSDEDK